MARLLGFVRTSLFLGWLCVMLATTTLAAGIWAVQMATTVATMSAQAAAAALAHRQQLARAVARAKAKARLQRLIVAVPVIGAGAIVYFEERDYRDWLEENPEGTRQQYLCEMSALTAEVIDEVLQDLPELLRPAPEILTASVPDCD